MARLSVYVPDELVAEVRAELPGLNVSRVLRAGLESLLDCDHEEWICADCRGHVDRVEVERSAVQRFYNAAMQRLEPLVFRAATAQGAAAALRDVAVEAGLQTAPAPRPTRTERDRARWEQRETA